MADEGADKEMPTLKDRGSRVNPPNPFERLHVEFDPPALDAGERRAISSIFYANPLRSVLSENNGPDIPFTYSLNPYRGCEHGCVYCYAPASKGIPPAP